MSSTYNGANGAVAPGTTVAITIPDDGDPLTAASNNVPDKSLADKIKSVIEKYVDLATAQTITALKTFVGASGVNAIVATGGAGADGVRSTGGSGGAGIHGVAGAAGRAAVEGVGTAGTHFGQKASFSAVDGHVYFQTPPSQLVTDDMSGYLSAKQCVAAWVYVKLNTSVSPIVLDGIHIASVVAAATEIVVTFANTIPVAWNCFIPSLTDSGGGTQLFLGWNSGTSNGNACHLVLRDASGTIIDPRSAGVNNLIFTLAVIGLA